MSKISTPDHFYSLILSIIDGWPLSSNLQFVFILQQSAFQAELGLRPDAAQHGLGDEEPWNLRRG